MERVRALKALFFKAYMLDETLNLRGLYMYLEEQWELSLYKIKQYLQELLQTGIIGIDEDLMWVWPTERFGRMVERNTSVYES